MIIQLLLLLLLLILLLCRSGYILHDLCVYSHFFSCRNKGGNFNSSSITKACWLVCWGSLSTFGIYLCRLERKEKCICVCMHAWMDAYMDGCIHGWMGVYRKNGWWIELRMWGCMHIVMDSWMDGYMDTWNGGWSDGGTCACIYGYIYPWNHPSIYYPWKIYLGMYLGRGLTSIVTTISLGRRTIKGSPWQQNEYLNRISKIKEQLQWENNASNPPTCTHLGSLKTEISQTFSK